MKISEKKKKLRLIIPLFMLLVCLVLSVIPIHAETVIATPPFDTKTNLVLNLLPGGYYDRIQAGEETKLFLELRNQGNSTVTSIHFNAGLPKGWAIRFVPMEIATLTPGSSTTIDAFITPEKYAGGGYNITLLAEADQTRAATSAYFNVKGGSNLWLWLGIGLGVIVIVAFVLVFLRQGK